MGEAKPIAFPDVKRFGELFSSARPASGQSNVVLDLPSWEAGTWSDRAKKTRFHLTAFCVIGGPDRRSVHVQPTEIVLDFVRRNVLHCSGDSMYFEIIVRDDGTALVIAQHNVICGSHWLAEIDANTIPSAAAIEVPL